MRILLVEDEKPLADAVCALLKQDGYEADAIYDGAEGFCAVMSGIYDAVILDVMLPGMDGFTVLRKLRAEGISAPVLMLTARGQLDDRIRGLEFGADYYLPKPFDENELLACIHTLTRRGNTNLIQNPAFGDLKLERSTAELVCSKTGYRVKLSSKEYQLIELFILNPNRILPRETTVEKIWGFENDAEYNTLSVYLSFLRKKMAFIGTDTEIRAVRGMGYIMEEKK